MSESYHLTTGTIRRGRRERRNREKLKGERVTGDRIERGKGSGMSQ